MATTRDRIADQQEATVECVPDGAAPHLNTTRSGAGTDHESAARLLLIMRLNKREPEALPFRRGLRLQDAKFDGDLGGVPLSQ